LNGTISNEAFDSASGAGSFDCTFPDGDATSDVAIQLEDSDGADSNLASKTVSIANVAPTVTLVGPTAANEGETKSYSYTVVDPGVDTFRLLTGYPTCGLNGTISNEVFDSASGAGSFDCTFRMATPHRMLRSSSKTRTERQQPGQQDCDHRQCRSDGNTGWPDRRQ